MLSIINSSNLIGIESFTVKVEIDIQNGIPCFNIVGLPGVQIKESRDRVKSAILNSGYKFPNSRITINLSPADMKKEGSYFDLAIALGILKDIIKKDDEYINESMFIGELSLDGNVRRIKGILPIVIGAKQNNIKRVFIPRENVLESSFIDDIEIIPINSLNECISYLNGKCKINKNEIYKDKNIKNEEIINYEEDFEDVKGNHFVKRAAEVSAAGNHNMIMIGPPGSGKTMIAKRIRTILPKIQKDEIIEVTKIYSACGKLNDNEGMVKKRPFRSPHHTSTRQALIGGGQNATPGEVVLAHRGVLFLDEMPEFDRKILETLRQPIEDKIINISRVKETITYPCNMLLIGAMNPCSCGYYMSDKECSCKQTNINKYKSKLSGPLLDRFDIFVQVNSIEFDELNSDVKLECSNDIRKRVEKARSIQQKRFEGECIKSNDEIKSSKLLEYCKLEKDSMQTLKLILEKYKLSNRSYTKLLKVSRTIADLEESDNVNSNHIMEAFSFRKAYYTYFK